MFKILKRDKRTKARLGVLSTPHGKIETPSYVIVATHAEVKCLKSSDIKKTKTQVVIANTYHLWEEVLNPKLETLNKPKTQNSKFKSFLTKKLGAKLPTMTDSGGFQVFSLRYPEKRVGKILKSDSSIHNDRGILTNSQIKITDKGVYFLLDGKKRFLGPELSMQIQEKLGADIIFAFDECTSPLDSFDYNKKALERTHAWAQASLKFKVKSEKLNEKRQMLFGIVQGGRFKSLRVKSAKFIGSLPFDGIGIGGSFGKDEMVKTLEWIVPHLPEEKPRHLLGIGKVEDIFNAVEQGIDLFDCVIPTREARHGRIYTRRGLIQTSRGLYADSKKLIDKNCLCPTCCKKITIGKIRKLIKSENENQRNQGKRWATIHNVWFFNRLLEEIRESIKNSGFKSLKNRFLKRFKS